MALSSRYAVNARSERREYSPSALQSKAPKHAAIALGMGKVHIVLIAVSTICFLQVPFITLRTSTDKGIFTAAALKRIGETQESITRKMADVGEIYPPVAETVDEESKITKETETVEQNEDSALSIEADHQDAPRRKRTKRTHVSVPNENKISVGGS